MTRDEAILGLSHGSPHARLKAARFFRKGASSADRTILAVHRAKENVAFVREALDAALTASVAAPPVPTASADLVDLPDDLKREARAEAVSWIAGLLLHELSSPIGLAELAAATEIPNYPQSETQKRLSAVKRTFGAIELLKNAATVANRESFDVGKFVEGVIFEERQGREVDVSIHGPKPMMTLADPKLLHLALANGLRNAFDATEALAPVGRRSIVVTWGANDIEHWISVIDSGVGLSHPPERAFEVGRTTKRNHSGFGLAIARQAMESMGGNASIEPGGAVGVRYELKWEI